MSKLTASVNTQKFKLTLLVRSFESKIALDHMQKALEHHNSSDYELAVVDVIEDPIQARSFGAIHTPMIVKHSENRKIFYSSDFSDVKQLRKSLGLLEKSADLL